MPKILILTAYLPIGIQRKGIHYRLHSEDGMKLEFAGIFFSDTGIITVPVLKIVSDANVYCVDEM